MRYMQIIEAHDPAGARRSYLEMLARRGVVLPATMEIFVETVHRPQQPGATWLCYVGGAMPHAA
jgi:hypothetical protein